MSLRFIPILTEGIAQLSYLVGDDSEGTAAVIDPRRDVEVYLETARELHLSITHIFETHIHADFISGARELAERSGTAKMYLSKEGDAKYGFDHVPIGDGDRFQFGKVTLTARFTPGHTPEHLSYEVSETKHSDSPFGVLTGDSLFVNSVGRPDLLGEEQSEELVEQLYHTIYDYYKQLPDHTIIYPCHGQGSSCGPQIGDRLHSTIGYEKKFNPYLDCDSLEDFKNKVNASAPPEPKHYRILKQFNGKGPEILGINPIVPALPPEEFKKRIQKGKSRLLDTRHILAFGGGHIEGALNIGSRPELSVWAGWMLDPEQPILLVLEEEQDLHKVVALLIRTGNFKFAGYLSGGMTAWENKGLPMKKLPQVTVQEIRKDFDSAKILDVRSPEEWEQGHIPGAEHHFVPELEENMHSMRKDQPVVTYCATGYRANIAASLLQANGFQHVHNIPGSWEAWTSAGYPIQNGGDGK